MPLPAISYTPSTRQTPTKPDDASDDSVEDGVNGILSMLRGNSSNQSEKPLSSNSSIQRGYSNIAEGSRNNATAKSSVVDTVDSKTPNSYNRRVKFDPAFDKPSESRGFSDDSSR